MLDEFVRIGSGVWWLLVGLVLAARACDLLSTWMATPNLALEANPLARRLGWRGGLLVNILLAPLVASWPLLAISLITTSLLVAARNSQNIWLMRLLGETGYRQWFSSRVSESPTWMVYASFFAESVLSSVPGFALLVFSSWQLIPFGIGLGIVGYSTAVAVFTALALHRRRTKGHIEYPFEMD
jgi:hypothetical protein